MSFAIGSGSMTSVIANWAAEHASSMSDELRNLMKAADDRAQLLKELNEVKSAVAQAASNPADFPKAEQIIKDFLERNPEYKGTLEFLVTDMQNEIRNYFDSETNTWRPLDAAQRNTLAGYIGSSGRWGTALDSAIDDLRTQDRMGMLGIEDLVDKLKQAEMLGSNLIRALHDSAASVIGNIG